VRGAERLPVIIETALGNSPETVMETIRLNAYGKINLSLAVLGRRPDGYHNISSLMQGIGLYDVVEIKKCSENGTKYNLPHCRIGGIIIYLDMHTKDVPTDMRNLALRGIAALAEAVETAPGYAELSGNAAGACSADNALASLLPESALLVSIDKRLPVAAGIAGGSGNAAACMLGLNALLGYPLSLRELMQKGAGVGADVPFSLMMNAASNRETLADLPGIEEASTAAWMTGIGDVVEPCEPLHRYVILANPGIAVSTPDAYRAVDELHAAQDAAQADEHAAQAGEYAAQAAQTAAQAGEVRRGDALFTNDFEEYTLNAYDEAGALSRAMHEQLSADRILMSGSGPTMVAYYTDRQKAEREFDRFRTEPGVRKWLTETGVTDKE